MAVEAGGSRSSLSGVIGFAVPSSLSLLSQQQRGARKKMQIEVAAEEGEEEEDVPKETAGNEGHVRTSSSASLSVDMAVLGAAQPTGLANERRQKLQQLQRTTPPPALHATVQERCFVCNAANLEIKKIPLRPTTGVDDILPTTVPGTTHQKGAAGVQSISEVLLVL
jgi:hypothetical protein